MTDVVARLRQLEAAATPGPWRMRVRKPLASKYTGPSHVVAGEPGPVRAAIADYARNVADYCADPDAELIAAARNALPQLLAITEAAAEVEATLSYDGSATLEAAQRLAAALAALDSQETE